MPSVSLLYARICVAWQKQPKEICVREADASSTWSFEELQLEVFKVHKLLQAKLAAGAGLRAHAAPNAANSRAARPALIGICLERSALYVTAVLAALRAGAAFLPLDPLWPDDRLQLVLSDAEPDVVIWASSQHGGAGRPPVLAANLGILLQLPAPGLDPANPSLPFDTGALQRHASDALPGSSVANMSLRLPVHASQSCQPAAVEACDAGALTLSRASAWSDVAYVMYTSGSTGKPKGVCGTLQGILNRCKWWQEVYGLQADDIGCFKTSPCFVDAIWEMFAPLLAGIMLVVVPQDTVRNPAALLATLAAHRVTHFVAVPSLLRALEPHLHPRPGLQLKVVVSSGGPLTCQLLQRLQVALPGTRILNLYGSTEVAADCTCFDATAWRPATALAAPLHCPAQHAEVSVSTKAACSVQPRARTSILPCSQDPVQPSDPFFSIQAASSAQPGAQQDQHTQPDAPHDQHAVSGQHAEHVQHAQVPVGFPIKDTTICIASFDGQPGSKPATARMHIKPHRQLGEVCVLGVGLAAGYLGEGEADASSQRFFEAPVQLLKHHVQDLLVPGSAYGTESDRQGRGGVQPPSTDKQQDLSLQSASEPEHQRITASALPELKQSGQQHSLPGPCNQRSEQQHSRLMPWDLHSGRQQHTVELLDRLAGSGTIRMFRTGDQGRITANGLELRGRVDLQVKLAGVRVDLSEVEAILLDHPMVQAAITRVWPGPHGAGQRLAAYVELHASSATSALLHPSPDVEDQLRLWCHSKLPAGAVPFHVSVLHELPRSSAGKVIRTGLPAPPWLQGSLPAQQQQCQIPSKATAVEHTTLWHPALQQAQQAQQQLFTLYQVTPLEHPRPQHPATQRAQQAQQLQLAASSSHHPQRAEQHSRPLITAGMTPSGLISEGLVMRAFVQATGQPRMEPTSDIFAFGGDSLAAAQVAGLLGIDPRIILAYPTARRLTVYLRALLHQDGPQPQAQLPAQQAQRVSGAVRPATYPASLRQPEAGGDPARASKDDDEPASKARSPNEATGAEAGLPVTSGRAYSTSAAPMPDTVADLPARKRLRRMIPPDAISAAATGAAAVPGNAADQPSTAITQEQLKRALRCGGMLCLPCAQSRAVALAGGVASVAAPQASFLHGHEDAAAAACCTPLVAAATASEAAPSQHNGAAATTAAEPQLQSAPAGEPPPAPGQGMPGAQELVWRVKLLECVDAAPLVFWQHGDEGRWWVWACSHGGDVVCIDGCSGAVVWQTLLPGRAAAGVALTLDGQHVAVACGDQQLYFLEACSGQLTGSCDVGGAMQAAPTVDPWRGLVWVGSHSRELVACAAPGRVVWRLPCTGALSAAPTFDPQRHRVYAADLSGALTAYVAEAACRAEPQVCWRHTCLGPIFAAPAVLPHTGTVIVNAVDGTIAALSHQGAPLWSLSLGAALFAPLCMLPPHPSSGTWAAVGTQTGSIHILDCVAGALLLSQQLADSPLNTSCTIMAMPSEPSQLPGNFQPASARAGDVPKPPRPQQADTPMGAAQLPAGAQPAKAAAVVGAVPTVLQGSRTSVVCCSAAGVLYQLVVEGSLPEAASRVSAQQQAVPPEDPDVSAVPASVLSMTCVAEVAMPGEMFSPPVVLGPLCLFGSRDDHGYCVDLGKPR